MATYHPLRRSSSSNPTTSLKRPRGCARPLNSLMSDIVRTSASLIASSNSRSCSLCDSGAACEDQGCAIHLGCPHFNWSPTRRASESWLATEGLYDCFPPRYHRDEGEVISGFHSTKTHALPSDRAQRRRDDECVGTTAQYREAAEAVGLTVMTFATSAL